MTAKLSDEAFYRAGLFIEREGRVLDAALLRFTFGHGSAEPVIEALAAYQNPDGGFGHGLEPDIASPASSALATSVALRFLGRVRVDGDHPMVRAALGWLELNFDWDAGVWPIITAAVDEAPHAPWWEWSKNLAESWNGFRYNPSAELLGYLYDYRQYASPNLLAAAEARMRRTIAETEIIEGAYDLKCAYRLMEVRNTPDDLRVPLFAIVMRSVLSHDPNDEHNDVLELAPTPSSLFARALAAQIETALAALIDTQQADGGWSPFWDWSFVDEAAWTKAKRDWRSSITRDAMVALKAWGRVEGG